MSDLYETLGVARDADPAAIKSAYRRAVKTAHPDAGGDTEKFNAVSLAYRVLSNADKRQRYDETGQIDDGADNSDTQAIQILDQMLVKFLNDDDAKYRDLVSFVKGEIAKETRNGEAFIADVMKTQKKLIDLRARLMKKPQKDVIGQLMDAKIAGTANSLESAQRTIDALTRAAALIEGYEFNAEQRPTPKSDPYTSYVDMSRSSTFGLRW